MENITLLTLLERFKKQDMTVFPVIFGEFEKLIGFYSSKLEREDSYQELTVFFLELLYKTDITRFEKDTSDTFTRYIAVCLRNQYIALSKLFVKDSGLLCSLFEEERDRSPDFAERYILGDALGVLPPKERQVILYRYIYGYSNGEIARHLGVTRQTVCNRKRQGVEKLRRYYEGEV